LISGLLAQVIDICGEKDLIHFDILSIDSVKIRANASYKQFRTKEAIEKEQEKIKEKLAALIDSALREESGLREQEYRILEARKQKLENAKAVLEERIKEKSEGKSQAEQAEIQKRERVNVTDPDCYMVQQGNGETNPGYAFTTATDVKADIITAVVTHEGGVNDGASLLPTIKESEKNCDGQHSTVNADSGFSTMDNLESLEASGQHALIPDKRMEVEERGETKRGDYDRSNFRYDKKNNRYICPAGVKLILTAICLVNGRRVMRYENQTSCMNCPFRSQCTKGNYRTISRDINEECRERMRERLRTKSGKARYATRAHAAESPFGGIKHNRKYRIFMRRGQAKAKMEFSMLLMLHNILKMQAIGS
jgi:hypothetical protein